MPHEKRQSITTVTRECFHLHTSRCKHASDDKDEDYIEAALRMGASKIVFTDHCPFSGNPFGNRMDIEQLTEYIRSLNFLKKKYVSLINVQVGLEAEYLPSFEAYYKKITEMEGLELMILGQHFYEVEPEVYSFSLEEKYGEYFGLGKAVLLDKNGLFFCCGTS